MLDRPDSFRVVHHYIEIWGYEASLDSVEPDKQVEFMAKRLNEWYKGNKDLIYTV